MKLKVRANVRDYQRDSYLGESSDLNGDFTPIDCSLGYAQWGTSLLAATAHSDFDPQCLSAYPEDMFFEKTLKPLLLDRFRVTGVEPSQIFFGHGSFNLAERIIHKLVEPTNMLGVGPQFNEIPSEFVAAGGNYNPIEIEGPDYGFPVTKIASALASGLPSLLYLDNPNNPLGYLISLEDIMLLAKTAAEFGTIVMVDEAYGDFVEDRFSAIHLVEQLPNLVVIRSFSKCLGLAAERIGYAFMSKELAKVYTALDVPFEPGLYAAQLAAATLQDKSFLKGIREEVKKVKATLSSTLETLGFTILPSHPAVSIMTLHSSIDNVVEKLASVGISVEPGSCFSTTHMGWNDHFCRIRVVRAGEEQELIKRLETLAGKS